MVLRGGTTRLFSRAGRQAPGEARRGAPQTCDPLALNFRGTALTIYLSSVKRAHSRSPLERPRVRPVGRSSPRLAGAPCAPPASAPWAKPRPRPPLMVVERLPAAGGVSRAASPPGRSHSGDGESEPHGVLDDLLSLELLLWNGRWIADPEARSTAPATKLVRLCDFLTCSRAPPVLAGAGGRASGQRRLQGP